MVTEVGKEVKISMMFAISVTFVLGIAYSLEHLPTPRDEIFAALNLDIA